MDAVVRVCGAASMIHDTETNLLVVLFPILPFLALSAVNLVSRPCFRPLTACLHTPIRTSQVTGREAGNARKRFLGALNNLSLAKPSQLGPSTFAPRRVSAGAGGKICRAQCCLLLFKKYTWV